MPIKIQNNTLRNESIHHTYAISNILNYQKYNKLSGDFNNISVFDFIDRMDFAYAASDLIISRAGAIAIAEISFQLDISLLRTGNLYSVLSKNNQQFYNHHYYLIQINQKSNH